MRHPQFFLVAAAIGLFAVSNLSAADLKVIANPSVGASSVSVDDLKGVFLATKTSLSDGSHVEPVLEKGGPLHEVFVKEYLRGSHVEPVLEKGGPLHEVLVKEYLGKTDAALQTYY